MSEPTVKRLRKVGVDYSKADHYLAGERNLYGSDD